MSNPKRLTDGEQRAPEENAVKLTPTQMLVRMSAAKRLQASDILIATTNELLERTKNEYLEQCKDNGSLRKQLAVKEATIKELREYLDIKQKQVYSFAAGVEEKNAEVQRLRKALKEVKAELSWGDYETVIDNAEAIINKALGE